jgi:peptidoglycan-associated lipoprotein
MQWATMAGLAGLLLLEGCAQLSLTVSSFAGPSPKVVVSEPVKAFTKAPPEEIVKPLIVAKAEPPAKEREAVMRDVLDVYFAFDRWALTPEGKKNLDQAIETLKKTPSAKLFIEGHCDERGSREYNLVLGEKRAQETRRYLQVLGVTNPVSVTSVGKERPVCTEHDESCYWKNRRAHLAVLDK